MVVGPETVARSQIYGRGGRDCAWGIWLDASQLTRGRSGEVDYRVIATWEHMKR